MTIQMFTLAMQVVIIVMLSGSVGLGIATRRAAKDAQIMIGRYRLAIDALEARLRKIEQERYP